MRDLQQETMVEYGSRAGVWRLMDILDEFRVKATIYGCAVALERNPAVGQEVTRRGHEVMGHGYRWESTTTCPARRRRSAFACASSP